METYNGLLIELRRLQNVYMNLSAQERNTKSGEDIREKIKGINKNLSSINLKNG